MSRSSSIGRFALERERIATVVLVGATLVAVVVVLLGGFLPTGEVADGLLYLLAVLFPAIGGGLVVAACWWALVARNGGAPSLVEGPPPETGTTRTYRRVGRESDWALDSTAEEWYRCLDDSSTESIRERLTDGAVRLLQARRGLERTRAQKTVENGTWTDDPVAAAFLADGTRQPTAERLRAAVDPGAASQRRIRRTLAAIEAIGHGSRRGRLDGTLADDPTERSPTEADETTVASSDPASDAGGESTEPSDVTDDADENALATEVDA
ncbi:DUF7269 family protein [Halopiger goleimassiliensis]|uniref:DUF7269 family protein n=1 Tax=Halopiger goleimassiliensis TaxID=1293048 RepID=UPI000A802586|nr:hypothetical protein [Halopiger goleimassiliensis]